jgi:hypothetical protein
MKRAKVSDAKMGKAKHKGVESLMEGIILQCITDLWIGGEIAACIRFFRGEGFALCANLAGMNLNDQAKVLALANKIIDLHTAVRDNHKLAENKKEFFTPAISALRDVNLPAMAMAHNSEGVCSI